MEQEIKNLIDHYDNLLNCKTNHMSQTTKEKDRLDGYDAALYRVISDLKDVLYRSKREISEKEKLNYTE